MKFNSIAMFSVSVGATIAAGSAYAQDAAAPQVNQAISDAEDNSGIADIVVTAQKRSENIQKVGIAIQAFTSDRLEQLGIRSSTAIGEFTPGVSFSGSAGGQNQNISIRGVTQNDYSDVVESPNALYFDDGYLPFQGAQSFALLDLQRIEVQKGPQGTLFGRNATGGLVQYISRKPSFDEFSGFVDVQAGVLDSPTNPLRYTVEAAVGGPLSDKIAFRVAGKFDKQDSYLINKYPLGQTLGPVSGDGADLGNDRTYSLRAILAFKPSENFSSQLTGFISRRRMSTAPFEQGQTIAVLDGNGTWIDTLKAGADETRLSIGPGGVDAGWDPGNTGTFTPGPPRPVPGGDYFGYKEPSKNFVISSAHAFSDPGYVRLSGIDMKNVLEISSDVTLTSVSDYKAIQKRDHTNVTGGPVGLIYQSSATDSWAFSQEARLNGQSGTFNWQAGLYYLHVHNISSGGLGIGLAAQSVNSLSRQITNSFSGFGQADWAFADKWKIIAGARYTREKKSVVFQQALYAQTNELYFPLRVGDPGLIANIGPNLDGSAYIDRTSEPLWAGKLQLEYAPTSDILIYAGVNRGVKAGGFNNQLPGGLPIPVALTPYKAEVLVNYEGGFKSSWLNNRLRVNASVFHYDYKNYQAFLFAGVGGIVINNDAKITGGELTVEAQPMRGLNIVAGASYTHARVYDVPTDVTYSVVRSSARPSYTPPWRTSLSARYSHRFLGGTLSENATMTYRDPIFFSIRNFSAIRDKSRTKFSLGLDWLDPTEKWTVAFNIENLTNERIKTTIFDVTSVCGCTVDSYELPRTFSLRMRYSF